MNDNVSTIYSMNNSLGYYSSGIEDLMEVYVAPFVVVFGLCGNLLSLICLRRPPLNNFSPSVYMSAYAFASILFLLLIVALDLCFHMLHIEHFRHYFDSVCRLWEFLTRLIIYSGVWFVTGGAIDRCVALWCPTKSQSMCTVFIAKIAVVFIFIGMTFVSVHSMWTFGRHSNGCGVDTNQLSNTVWLWISSMLYTLIPQTLLFLFVNLIVIRLCLKHRGRQIPESVSVEMDQTYAIAILATVVFIFSMPATTIHLLSYFYTKSFEQIHIANIISNYIIWICHVCLVVILSSCSRAFRESVKSLCFGCVTFFRTGSSVLEMRITKEDYQQVPSVSTNL